MRGRVAVGCGLAALALVGAAGVRGDREPAARISFTPGVPVAIGPVPAGLTATDAASCGGCHVEEHQEWSDSMHRRSYSDPFFQEGYRLDPHPFCRDCHAPRGPSAGAAARQDGVDCATCHVRDGHVLTRSVPVPNRAPHPLRAAPELGESSFCAGCHEFHFPEPPLVPRSLFNPTLLMQSTHDEWQASAAGREGATCQSCHLPNATHRVLGFRDRELLDRAARVEVTPSRREDGTVRVRVDLDATATGHALPTGDVLRQLQLTASLGEHQDRRTFARHFERGDGPDAPLAPIRQLRDDRPGAPGQPPRRTFFLSLPALDGALEWRLEILRARPDLARRQGISDADNRVLLVRGTEPVPEVMR